MKSMEFMPTPAVPVSWGELLDKMTILHIKQARITAPAALDHIAKEYRLLSAQGAPALQIGPVGALVERLRKVNEALWDIEDAIREKEAAAQFDPDFIDLARSVYRMNDRRAAIKREINLLLDSELVEEKSYACAG